MTALEAYIEANKHNTKLWDKLNTVVKYTIEKAINNNKCCAIISQLNQEDRRILERLKYHVYWNDVYWVISWDIKMK